MEGNLINLNVQQKIFIPTILVALISFGQVPLAFCEQVAQTRIEPIWETENDDILVGLLIDATRDEAGNFYLLDYRLQVVLMLDSKGNLIRTIGANGDGPGETQAASRLLQDDEQNIGLLDITSRNVEWLSISGDPIDSTDLRLNDDGSGTLAVYDARYWNGGYVAAFMVRNPVESESMFQIALAYLPSNGESARILATTPDRSTSWRGETVSEFDSYNYVYNCWDVNSVGEVFLAPRRNSPTIDVVSCVGESPRQFDSSIQRIKRTDSEGKSEAFDPYCAHLWCDDSDRVWVMSHARKSANPKVLRQYDVHSAKGDFLFRQDFLGQHGYEYDSRTDDWFFVDEHYLIIVENVRDLPESSLGGTRPGDAQDGPAIVCYMFDAGLE